MNAAQFFDHWNKVWRDFMRAIALLKNEHLAFRPTENYARSVGDILRHIINLEEGWIHFVVRRELPEWPEENVPDDIDDLRQALIKVHQDSMDYLSTIPVDDFNRIIQVPDNGTPKLGWILWHVFEQQIHHRGELFLCLSLLGLERPKTDRPG